MLPGPHRAPRSPHSCRIVSKFCEIGGKTAGVLTCGGQITDSLFRVNEVAKRTRYTALADEVQAGGGTAVIFSGAHALSHHAICLSLTFVSTLFQHTSTQSMLLPAFVNFNVISFDIVLRAAACYKLVKLRCSSSCFSMCC